MPHFKNFEANFLKRFGKYTTCRPVEYSSLTVPLTLATVVNPDLTSRRERRVRLVQCPLFGSNAARYHVVETLLN